MTAFTYAETENMETADEKEAETAFVLIKRSLSCDLKNVEELLQALQAAGCSPSTDDLPKSEESPFSFLTFCKILKMIKPVKKDTLRDAFRCFDKSNCGTISISKLNALMIENCVERRGFFVHDHIENQTIISSHQYRITNVELQNITFEIQHLAGAFDTKILQTVDVWIIIYDEDDRIVQLSTIDNDTSQGKSIIHQQLPAGRYIIVPFTTQCLFRPRKTIESEKNKVPLLKVDRAGKACLTKEMKLVLMNIFDLCDLDNNGTLTREEFNLYNIRTGDENVSDEEWNVIQEHFDLKNEELTLRDFLALHDMEAEDCKSDTTDMWLSLESMGCNYKLELDEIIAFGIPKQLGNPIKVVAEFIPSQKV
ncbi:EF-hand calcium-binding domain-containing protein 7 [Trichinella pseudospiralis]|nr:EF-hand calcium-binding domain-containing protein 7 [Trichinella pseudospiralis]KRZ28259.1 EF-hand calcium-binding domain-containing protein 7 [Trichinella pseudospiralis]KRZ34170.1 EF-hand calcium-binding domain-containing protein 7 [Trichinella pseudospiralis]